MEEHSLTNIDHLEIKLYKNICPIAKFLGDLLIYYYNKRYGL